METIILLIVYFLSALVASIIPVHMYQLASYQWPGYLRWLKESSGNVVMGFWPIILASMLGLFNGYAVPWVGIGVYVLLAVLCRPKKPKKPFRLTARAVRLFAVLILMLGSIASIAFFLQGRFRYTLLATGYIGIFFWVPAAGAICLPIQKT